MKKLKKYLVKNGYTPIGLYYVIHIIEIIVLIPVLLFVCALSSTFYDTQVVIICIGLAAFVIFGISAYFSMNLCRCPGCGRPIYPDNLWERHCPICGADLDDKFSWQSLIEYEIAQENLDKNELAVEPSGDLTKENTNEDKPEEKKYVVRTAEAKDIPYLLSLLSQVLEVHARLKPDYFISGHTKYSAEELAEILSEESKRVYVAEAEGAVVGQAFCELKEMPDKPFVEHFKYMYIDDVCVDLYFRGKDVAKEIFEHVKEEAKILGCRDITLNVWEGNDRARAFFDKMGMTPLKTYMELKI